MTTTFREHLQEQLQDPEFQKAWEETELAYEVARAVIKLRLENGLTQEELAQKIGVPQSVISRFESGRHLPSFRSLERISKKLGLQIRLGFIQHNKED